MARTQTVVVVFNSFPQNASRFYARPVSRATAILVRKVTVNRAEVSPDKSVLVVQCFEKIHSESDRTNAEGGAIRSRATRCAAAFRGAHNLQSILAVKKFHIGRSIDSEAWVRRPRLFRISAVTKRQPSGAALVTRSAYKPASRNSHSF
jgi:hypothetical protein